MHFTGLHARYGPLTLLVLAGCPAPSAAQPDLSVIAPWLELAAEHADDPEALDLQLIGELIERWTADPLDLNSPEAEALVEWHLLSPHAYQALQEHIGSRGRLLSILELQAIEGFSPSLIRLLRQIAVAGEPGALRVTVPLGLRFIQGRQEIYLRGGRQLQRASGYAGAEPAYAGSPDRLFLRFRHRHGNSVSYGLSMEKDAGERMVVPGRIPLPDFTSWHLALHQPLPWLETAVAGDFTVSLGQGLLHNGGFSGTGIGATGIKRTGRTIRPYTSVDENNYMRGIAATVRPSPSLDVSLFASHRSRDANAISDSTFAHGQPEDIVQSVTSLQTSGLHRTAAELADKGAVGLSQFGFRIGYGRKRNRFNINVLHTQLRHPMIRDPELYNQFYFTGRRLTQASVDYGFYIGGIHFFGESAVSDNGGSAHLAGILAALDRKVNFALIGRSYGRAYHSLSARAFGENTQPNNERGLYTGLQLLPAPRWRIDLIHDMWRHPWLRFNVDSPSDGFTSQLRIGYTVRRRLELFAQYRHRQTHTNHRPVGEAIASVVPQQSRQFRLQLNQSMTRAVEFRTRLGWTMYSRKQSTSEGLLIAQDILFHPLGSPWSGTLRVALFDTDDYDSRIYAYENDLIYYYAIPAYSDTGARYYITLRYKGIPNLTIEGKVAETLYRDLLTVGSGHDQTVGNRRTEVRMQIIYRN